MICKNCGTTLVDGVKFCQACGTPVEGVNNQVVNANNPQVNAMNNQVVQPVNNMNIQGYPNGMYNNQPYNQVPQYNAGYNTPMSPYTNPNQKNNNKTWIIVGVIAAVVLFFIVVGSMASHSDSSTSSNNNGTTNNSSVKTETTKPYTLKGYTFQVPTSFNAEISGTNLKLTRNNGNDIALISVLDGDFNNIKSSQSYIKSYIENSGYNVYNVNTKTIGGMEFVISEVSQNSQKMLLGYSRFDSTHMFMIVVGNTRYTFDYDLVEDIVPVLKSAK